MPLREQPLLATACCHRHKFARLFLKVPPQTAVSSRGREPPLQGAATSSRRCKLLLREPPL